MSEDNPTRSPTLTDLLREGDNEGVKTALRLFRQAFTELRAYQILKTSNGWQSAEETEEKNRAFSHLEHCLIEENGSTFCPHCGNSAPSIFTAYQEDADEYHCVWCIEAEEDKEGV